MRPRRGLYVQDKRYGSRRKRRSPVVFLSVFTILLVMVTGVFALVRYGPDWFAGTQPQAKDTQRPSDSESQPQDSSTTAQEPQEPTVTPEPTPIPDSWNPLLLPYEAQGRFEPGPLVSGLSPVEQNLQTTCFNNAFEPLAAYERPHPLQFGHPLDYQDIAGVLTFRGNHYRNAPAYGTAALQDKTMTQDWRKGIGSLPSSAWSFSWTGTGWTGQPLLVQWDEPVRAIMNLHADKKNKAGLVEVIYATLDGNIYFLDLDDGKPTREPISIGAPIKGTPCVDPRGYPILYVGQGDKNSAVQGIGFRIYNLIDQSLLLYRDCSKDPSHRPEWAACDSSPLVDGPSDTLIFPNENGLVYTLRLNTVFDLQAASLRIDPEYTSYRYKMGNQKDQGIESSMAIYGHYGYFNDNSGIFHCIDLNRMVPVWSRQLEDDSDVTPLLKQEADRLVVYTGTEVDWQKGIIGVYQGTAFVYKLDAMTGEILWEQTVPCYTKKAADHGDDINGGVMGTPIMGKRGLEGSVIFSFCMTNGVYSGNSLIAFDETDGSVLWEYQMTHYTWSSPVDLYDEQGNGYIVIPDSQSQLHLLDGKTGQLLDVLQLVFDENGQGAGNIESSCAVFNNQLVIGTRGNIIAGVTLH